MNIDITAGSARSAKSIDWQQILSTVGEVQKADNVDGKESFTITMRNNGEITTSTITIPEDLEIPEEVNAGALADLVSKLESSGLGFTPSQIAEMKDAVTKLYNESAQTINEAQASANNKRTTVMFNIYAIMALLIDVAQSQRDAAREMRTTENIAVQNSIQSQADRQREAAWCGMMVGIVCGVASAGVSVGLMIGQGVTAKMQSDIVKQSGADASKMQSQMLQNTDSKDKARLQMESTMNKVGDAVATKVSAEFENAVSHSTGGNLTNNLGEALHGKDVADAKLVTANSELQAAERTLDTKTATRNELQQRYNALGGDDAIKAADDSSKAMSEKQQYITDQMNKNQVADEQKIAEFDARITKTQDEINEIKSVKSQLDTANQEVTAATEQVNVKQGNVRIAQEGVTAADTKLATARSDYQKTVNDMAAKYKENYQSAVDRQANPPEGMTKEQLAADVQSAREDMEMAFACQANMLANDGFMTPSQQKDIVQGYRMEADNAMQRVYQRSDYKGAERKLGTLMAWNSINQSMGGVLQSLASNWSSMLQANATEQGSETTKQEELLDQTKDLFSQEEEVINQVIQLCQSVIQAESQSMRDAIQA